MCGGEKGSTSSFRNVLFSNLRCTVSGAPVKGDVHGYLVSMGNI